MSVLTSVQYFVLGTIVSVPVVARPVILIMRFRRALRDSRAASIAESSAAALFVTMVLLNPQLWLAVGLLGVGGYYVSSHIVSTQTISLLWGVALGAPLMGMLTILVRRRQKRLASAKSNASTHVA